MPHTSMYYLAYTNNIAKTPSGVETTPSGTRKSESRQGNSARPTEVKTVPAAGSKGTPSGQPRRIQFITLYPMGKHLEGGFYCEGKDLSFQHCYMIGYDHTSTCNDILLVKEVIKWDDLVFIV